MQKIKKENGITMIALIATLSILMIIFGVTIYNTKKSLAIKDLTNLYNDIEMLEDRAKVYYAEHGEFPVTDETTNIEGCSEILYQIDSSKINNINGLHYRIEDYYIDITTGRVYLNNGVEYEGSSYHTKVQGEYTVEALNDPIWAYEVSFEPEDKDWKNVENVKQALDWLFNN